MSGSSALDFCIKSENRSGFHPELQAEIQYGLEASQVQWPKDFLKVARAFLRKEAGWEQVDEWIREERDSYPQLEDDVAQTLMDNVCDEIDYADALWVGDYQGALKKARACADRLSGDTLSDYRAWWYYLAGSVAALSASRDNSGHLHDTARDLFSRACAASPRATWFREATRLIGLPLSDEPLDDPLLLTASEAIERRIQQIGIAGAGFENEVKTMLEQLNDSEATSFEQGLERLGLWLGLDAVRPSGPGVPDGVWPFSTETILAFEAKSNEQPTGPISLSTAREAQGHIRWIESNMPGPDSTQIATVVVSDRTTVASEALPNTEALFVVTLAFVRELGRRVASTMRSIRAEASEVSNENFRRVIAERLKNEELDPKSIQAALQRDPLSDFPVLN